MKGKELPYVDLLEAIRIVVRLMPDGARLAGLMDDEWIERSLGILMRCRAPGDESWLTEIYGKDWEATRTATNHACEEAMKVLESVLPKGKVRGQGVCCTKQTEGHRPITEIEWASRRVELKDGLLATPFREKPEHFPAILSVRVNADDVRREGAKVIKSFQVKAKADNASTPLSDHEAATLIKNAADKNGGFVSLLDGAAILRERDPNMTRDRARLIVKCIIGNKKPGPKAPRKNRADKRAEDF